jgi:hypothetical protein
LHGSNRALSSGPPPGSGSKPAGTGLLGSGPWPAGAPSTMLPSQICGWPLLNKFWLSFRLRCVAGLFLTGSGSRSGSVSLAAQATQHPASPCFTRFMFTHKTSNSRHACDFWQ